MSNHDRDIEVSAVMPCLNEEATIGTCIEKAKNCFAALGVRGEIIVADNGSTDRSAEIARSLGARVVYESVRGYGAALKAGITAANGRLCIMADCDDSYDWGAMGAFIEKLREGYDLVMGTRLKGTILPGAMPPLHKFFGNPFLSGTMNLFFRTGVSDAYCGMRGFTRDAFDRLDPHSQGMEFAIEMVVKAANRKMRITEVPITLHPDGRTGPSHLRSFRDGWRTLRLLLLYAPDYLYLIPGGTLFTVGAVVQALLLTGPLDVFGVHFGVHWLALGCLFSLLGFQIISLGAFAKAFAMNESFDMRGPFFSRVMSWFTLEAGIIIGAGMIWLGILADTAILTTWIIRDRGYLGSTHAVFVATNVIAIGFQVVFSSFFLGMFKLGVPRPNQADRNEGSSDQ